MLGIMALIVKVFKLIYLHVADVVGLCKQVIDLGCAFATVVATWSVIRICYFVSIRCTSCFMIRKSTLILNPWLSIV